MLIETLRASGRTDDDVGYVRKNIAPCCKRCNMLKRDMPLAAWKVLVPAVRDAARRGLFGDWNGHMSKDGGFHKKDDQKHGKK